MIERAFQEVKRPRVLCDTLGGQRMGYVEGSGEAMQRARRVAPRALRTDADTGTWLIRCAKALERVARAELRYRGAIARGAPLFALKQRNHDVLFSARATAAFPGPTLRIPEQILSCLAYGRYKISQGQIARVA